MLRRTLTLGFVLIAACGLLVACGGDDEEDPVVTEYRAALDKLSEREQVVQSRAEAALQADSVDEIRTRMTRYAADEERLSKDVAALNPPADAKAANARLAKGAGDLATEIRAALRELGQVDSAREGLRVLDRELVNSRGAGQAAAALQELEKLGYN